MLKAGSEKKKMRLSMHAQYKINATIVPFLHILLIPSAYSCFPHNKEVYPQQKYIKNK